MKALTLTQPYATLIALGAKTIETRGWSTTYRGPLAIHAAQGLGPVGGKRGLREICCFDETFYWALRDHITSIQGSPLELADVLPRGCVVAVCRLVDSTKLTTQHGKAYRWNTPTQSWALVPEPEASFGDYSEGRYGILLADVRALPEPIPAKGALGLWDWHPPEGWAVPEA